MILYIFIAFVLNTILKFAIIYRFKNHYQKQVKLWKRYYLKISIIYKKGIFLTLK